MARFTEPTREQEIGWREWVESRPLGVRDVAKCFEPWSLYRMKSTGQRVVLTGFDEGKHAVAVRVAVTGEFNFTVFEREVFGVDPGDLEPCDLPTPEETLGTVVTSVDDNIDALRVLVRPDLWRLDDDGRAVREN